jgi:hypothetical protein
MDDVRNLQTLEGIIYREGRSFLQYVRESFPWTTPTEKDLLVQLEQLAREEGTALTRLGRFLQRRRHPVATLPPFPMEFTTQNFVSLGSLLPQLAADERRGLAALEQDLQAVTDPEGRELVQSLIAMKQSHVQTLEQLAGRGQPHAA